MFGQSQMRHTLREYQIVEWLGILSRMETSIALARRLCNDWFNDRGTESVPHYRMFYCGSGGFVELRFICLVASANYSIYVSITMDERVDPFFLLN